MKAADLDPRAVFQARGIVKTYHMGEVSVAALRGVEVEVAEALLGASELARREEVLREHGPRRLRAGDAEAVAHTRELARAAARQYELHGRIVAVISLEIHAMFLR